MGMRDQAIGRFARGAMRSFHEFLAIPALIVLLFFVSAIVVDRLDNDEAATAYWAPLRNFLGQYVTDTQSAINMLTAIAGSLLTVSSITFSILLLAVQQGASALNSQIVDHYLRRTSNRVYFGLFIGTCVFVLVTLVQTTHTPHPILGVATSTICAAISLFTLLLLIYTTIDQTRAISIVTTIHDAAVAARHRQVAWIGKTQPPERSGSSTGVAVPSDRAGYLASVNVEALGRIARQHPGIRIDIAHPVGTYLSAGETIATFGDASDAAAIGAMIRAALPIDERRNIRNDASYCVDHLQNIGWTAISTAKSDPAVGAIIVHMLKNLLLTTGAERRCAPAPGTSGISYPDRFRRYLFDSLESMVVAAAESRQQQTLALIVNDVATIIERSPEADAGRIASLLGVVAQTAKAHTRTAALDRSLARLVAAMRGHPCGRLAMEAERELAALASRSATAPPAPGH
jgi:uncharacterized membrane protein